MSPGYLKTLVCLGRGSVEQVLSLESSLDSHTSRCPAASSLNLSRIAVLQCTIQSVTRGNTIIHLQINNKAYF